MSGAKPSSFLVHRRLQRSVTTILSEECPLKTRGIPAAVKVRTCGTHLSRGQIESEMTAKPASFWCVAGQGMGWRLRQVAWEEGGELF